MEKKPEEQVKKYEIDIKDIIPEGIYARVRYFPMGGMYLKKDEKEEEW